MTRSKLTRDAGRILLNHDPVLRQKSWWIFAAPVSHVLVGFLFNGSADKTGFYLTSILCPEFQGRYAGGIGLGDRIMTPAHPGGWLRFDDPHLSEKLTHAYETVVRPWVPLAASLPDFLTYAKAHEFEKHWYDLQAYCAAASGDFDTARTLLDKAIDDLVERQTGWSPQSGGECNQSPPHPLLPEYKEMRACLDLGPEAVAEHLRANELKSMQSRHLEKYWQPTPFPFEVKG